MKLENAKKIVEFLNDNGIEASVYENYSGRGMYGKTTAGVVAPSIADVGWAAGQIGMKRAPQRSDNMGLSYIVY